MLDPQGALLLRAGSSDDAEILVALTQEAYRANHEQTGLYDYIYGETPETVRAALAQGDWLPLIVERDGEPVASARISTSAPGRITFWRLGVRPDQQGQGIGRLLIDAAERWAAAWGRAWVTLGALEASPENRALYERLGYSAFARKEMGSAPGHFYTLMRKPIQRPAINPTVARYQEIAEDYQQRHGQVNDWTAAALQTFQRVLPAPAHVLDLGCGPGRDSAYLRENGYTVLALDPASAMLQRAARTGAQCLQADGRALPFSTAALDGVWASASLLHLPRIELVIALVEIQRVLRPGGGLYLALKQGHGEVIQDHRHFAFYQTDEITRSLRGAGFSVVDQAVTPDPRPGSPPWITTVARLASPAAPVDQAAARPLEASA